MHFRVKIPRKFQMSGTEHFHFVECKIEAKCHNNNETLQYRQPPTLFRKLQCSVGQETSFFRNHMSQMVARALRFAIYHPSCHLYELVLSHSTKTSHWGTSTQRAFKISVIKHTRKNVWMGPIQIKMASDKVRSLKTSTQNLIVKGCAIHRDCVSASKESRALREAAFIHRQCVSFNFRTGEYPRLAFLHVYESRFSRIQGQPVQFGRSDVKRFNTIKT